MANLEIKGIYYEPAQNFKFKFSTLPESQEPVEDRKIEELLERVEKKIGRTIKEILDLK
jgi:hypothetical protein